MNITRNLLHEWYHGGARTSADVRHLAAERLGLQLTAEKVANILRDQIPLEQWYQTRIMQAIKAAYPDAFVRKISAGVYSEKGFPDILVIIDGRYYGIEAKRPFVGKPSPNQVATILKIRKAGGVADLVPSPQKPPNSPPLHGVPLKSASSSAMPSVHTPTLIRQWRTPQPSAAAKKALHNADVQIRRLLGQRFRLKLKKNQQVCKFFYQGKRKAMGRPLDFMGFVFYRDKTIIRKRIMLKATQTARHLHKAKEAGRSYCRHNIAAMLSYMGWFSCTDTYECFKRRIKPNVKIGKLKEIISKLDRRKKNHETLGTRSMLQSA